MSGYLEVKYFKSNLGLNPFKSWKRQWCILRPSATCGGGSLAVYCSEAGSMGAAAGCVPLPAGGAVRRAQSRSRPHAFAVFAPTDRKPRLLLAAHTAHDAQLWMDKIRALLNGDRLFGTESLLKDSFSMTVIPTELSLKCGVEGDRTVSLSTTGLLFKRAHKSATFIHWRHIKDIFMCPDDKNGTCILIVDRSWEGGGRLRLSSPRAAELCARALTHRPPAATPAAATTPARAKSDTDLRARGLQEEVRRSSWNSGPSEVSLDDIDLEMTKDRGSPWSRLSRCDARDLTTNVHSISERRSMVSIASGIYEEIPDLPEGGNAEGAYCTMAGSSVKSEGGVVKCEVQCDVQCSVGVEEPTYEVVGESVFATLRPARRRRPPPLPPRGAQPNGGSGGGGGGGGGWGCVTRHGSLGALPPPQQQRTFSVFRKRLKSDSRIACSPKSDSSKESKSVETKKKKFDFTPTRDIFKSFKVSRKMKNLKINSNSLSKGETKSCEFLDETEHVKTSRCSKSVECLEDQYVEEYDGDISIEFNDEAVAALALPQEIVDLFLRGREQLNKIKLKDSQIESDYMPMSPIVPPAPIEHHYIVMSPKTNIA